MKRSFDRGADALRPVRFTRSYTRHAEGSVLVSRIRPHAQVLFGTRERRGEGSAVPEGQGARLGHGRVRHAAARDQYPQLPRGGERQAIGAHAGDPAPHRAQPARSHGPREAGRAPDHHRLRRAAGRRRHALRLDHRIHGRARRARSRGCAASRGCSSVDPLRDFVAAVSVGIVAGEPVLDLDYAEDSGCDTDMNVVMTGAGHFVEIQGTAEKVPFTREQMARRVAPTSPARAFPS